MGLFVWVKTTKWSLKFKVFLCHVDGPGKLLTLGFVVDLLDGNVPLLTPGGRQAERRLQSSAAARGRAETETRRGEFEVLTTPPRCGGPGS